MEFNKVIKHVIGYPYINGVVDIEKYKEWKTRLHRTATAQFHSGVFRVIFAGIVHKTGYLRVLSQDNTMYRIPMEPKYIKYFSEGDTFIGAVKRELFYADANIISLHSYEKSN